MTKAKRKTTKKADTKSAAKEYAIRYSGSQPSYFKGWVEGAQVTLTSGRKTGLPAFGATLAKAARYATSELANEQVDAMPLQARIMCDVVAVAPKKQKKTA